MSDALKLEVRLQALELLIANLYALDQVRMGGGSDLNQSLEKLMAPGASDELREAVDRVIDMVPRLAR